MIISASRRTDIPAFYSDWFFHRLKERFVLVRNPMSYHQISRIDLSPDVIDGIVFWTKNPAPMLARLDKLEPFPFYFQFTLNAYGADVEKKLPVKNDVLVPVFQKLSGAIGSDRVVWRYDPIFFSEKYTLEYHCKYFEMLAARLSGFTETCTVSFLDYYRNTSRSMRPLNVLPETYARQLELMERFAVIGKKYGICLNTCAEKLELEPLGVNHASCIDKARLERIGGYPLDVKKDKNQRPECGCVSSVDIGAYHCCGNGCLYCYANDNPRIVDQNRREHRPDSPLLLGRPNTDDVIRTRETGSFRSCQPRLFE